MKKKTGPRFDKDGYEIGYNPKRSKYAKVVPRELIPFLTRSRKLIEKPKLMLEINKKLYDQVMAASIENDVSSSSIFSRALKKYLKELKRAA